MTERNRAYFAKLAGLEGREDELEAWITARHSDWRRGHGLDVAPLPEGARWDLGTLVLANGRRLRADEDKPMVSLWNDSWHPDGTDQCDYPRTVEEALGVVAVLARPREGGR